MAGGVLNAVLSLQIGQFIGTRADFVPEPICKKLSLLQDKVPALLHMGTEVEVVGLV